MRCKCIGQNCRKGDTSSVTACAVPPSPQGEGSGGRGLFAQREESPAEGTEKGTSFVRRTKEVPLFFEMIGRMGRRFACRFEADQTGSAGDSAVSSSSPEGGIAKA